MVIISQYHLESDKKGRIHIKSDEISVCPACFRKLIVIGSRIRKLINSAGDKQKIVIRRLYCQLCEKIHHELPDTIIPYKRHCAETIEKVIAGEVEDVYCCFATERRIRAWWAELLLYVKKVLASLQIKYGATFSVGEAPREIARALANTNLWVHTRSASMSS